MTTPTRAQLLKRLEAIPHHAVSLPDEANSPKLHFEHGIGESYNLWQYCKYHFRVEELRDDETWQRHSRNLRMFVFIGLIEALERFLKELYAVCVDELHPLVLDDRFKKMKPSAAAFAAHYANASVGRALVEQDTFLDVDDLNRFNAVLADHFKTDHPLSIPPDVREGLQVLFQLRHSVVHNVGVLTQSDASKLRLLTRQPVDAPRKLNFTTSDIWYTKLFLTDAVETINRLVATRLCQLLSDRYGALHTPQSEPSFPFLPQEKAALLARLFQNTCTVARHTANP